MHTTQDITVTSLHYPNNPYSMSQFLRLQLKASTDSGVDKRLALIMRPLTLEIDRATPPFLKIDMRHEAYRHEKIYKWHDMGLSLNSTGDIWLF